MPGVGEQAPGAGAAIVATDVTGIGMCGHCGRPLDAARPRRGLPRRFCCPAHREAARLRRERGLAEDYPMRDTRRQGRRRLGA